MKFQHYFKKQKPENNSSVEFIDKLFPPEKSSMCWVLPGGEVEKDLLDEEREILDSYKYWHRAKTIFSTENFYLYEKLDIEDINQGEIGNCYFLSTLSAIAEYAERFKEIFISNKKAENGCYQINFYLNGKPKTVILDDYFPCKTEHRPYWSLAHCNSRELWVQLLEKAWAKVNGSYASTIAGLPSEAFSVLTEAPTFSYINSKYSVDELWKIILDADDRKYIICTNSNNNVEEMTGLVKGHAYTIISAYEYENVRLLKLRNPWGSYEWTGDFSDKSEKWTKKLREHVGVKNIDDGVFFMKIEDFKKYFPHMFICKYKNDYFYNYEKFHQDNRDQFICTKFNIKEPTDAVITLHQKQQRFYRKVPNYKAVYGSLILAKFDKEKFPCYEYYNSSCSNDEKIHFELENLPTGEYHIFANINWTYESRCNFTISCYSEKEVKFEKLLNEEIPNNYLLQILNSFMEKNVKKDFPSEKVGVQMSLLNNNTGFFITKFSNYYTDQFLKINLNVSKNEKVYICKLNLDGLVTLDQKEENGITKSSYEILVGKNSNQIIIWRLLDHPGRVDFRINNCSFSTSYEIPKNFLHEKDQVMKYIAEHLDHTNGQKLEENLILKELEYFDSIVFVVVNNNKIGNYIVKVEFENVGNLSLGNEKTKIMVVENMKRNYFLVKKNSELNNTKYSLIYSIKKQ